MAVLCSHRTQTYTLRPRRAFRTAAVLYSCMFTYTICDEVDVSLETSIEQQQVYCRCCPITALIHQRTMHAHKRIRILRT